jgi:dihydropyrimidinase
MGTSSSDSFESGTAAALFGGTTTIIDFAIQTQGRSLTEALHEWDLRAGNNTYCDYSYHMAVTDFNESTRAEIKTMVETHGISSFKIFMAYEGALMVDDKMIVNLMQEARKYNAVVTGHCTNGDMISTLVRDALRDGKTSPRYHALTQPAVTENEATGRFTDMAHLTDCRSYVVHCTTEGALQRVQDCQKRQQKVFVETCPQYLLLDDSLYGGDDGSFEGAKYVISPPLRTKKDQESLWGGIETGVVDVLATDHCPFTLAQKEMGRGNFSKIPNGLPAIEHRMELLFSEGVVKRGMSLNKFVDLTSTNAAKIFGMYPRKGSISPGSDADLVIIDPSINHTLSSSTHHMNCDYSAFEGFAVQGKVDTVLMRGAVAVAKGQSGLGVAKGYGKFVKRATFSSY